ncbi:MAG: Na+/H+ antiporter NhaC [Brevinemataceae bacterium]
MRIKKSESSVAFICVSIVLLALYFFMMIGKIYISSAEILLIAASTAAVAAICQGFSWDEIQEAVLQKISDTLPGILIIISVGFVIGTWMIGGTIPMLIYYGLKLVDVKDLLAASFFLTSIVATATGTSWGSAGTAGIVLVGIAGTAGVPLAPVAGAVVCGAYFGDKISPLSDTTNLAAISSGTTVYKHVNHMLKTTLPAYLISMVIFIFVGRTFSSYMFNTNEISLTISVLDQLFTYNIFLWFPVICILAGSLMKKPPIPVMIISGFIAVSNAVLVQKFSLSQALTAGISGFDISFFSTHSQQLLQLTPKIISFLNRGGMNSMLGALLVMILAYSCTGILALTGAFNIFIRKAITWIHGSASLIIVTMISAFTLGIMSETYVSLIVTGDLFKDLYKKFHLAPENLSRALEDSVTGTQPFIPWTAAGIYMSSTLGVPTIEYMPWAILTYVSIFFGICSALSGVGITTLKTKSHSHSNYFSAES